MTLRQFFPDLMRFPIAGTAFPHRDGAGKSVSERAVDLECPGVA